MRIKNPGERRFYEIEATESTWSLRTLHRQYNSSLYEWLALIRNKDEVIRLAQRFWNFWGWKNRQDIWKPLWNQKL